MGEVFLQAVSNVFTINNIIMAALGTCLGILFGALPGFTAAMGVAVLLPLPLVCTLLQD